MEPRVVRISIAPVKSLGLVHPEEVVLERAGVSRPTFYEHFENKEACFLAAFDNAARRLRERPQRDSRLPDLPGALMLASSLALVTLTIVEGNDWGWSATSTLGAAGKRMIG